MGTSGSRPAVLRNRNGSTLDYENISGDCWSSSLNMDRIWSAGNLDYNSNDQECYNNARYFGFTVRPVHP